MESAKKSSSEDDDNVAADFIAGSFNSKPFFRTFSYRDLLTAITFSLLLSAFLGILDYYRDERFIEKWSGVIRITGVLLIILANHIYYRFEHGRSNSLMGRSLFDMLFLISYSLIKLTFLWITTPSHQFSLPDLGEILVGIPIGILLVFMFEFLVSLLKYLLKFLRCPVL